MRDMRDPTELGEVYLRLRGRKRPVSIAKAVTTDAPPYRDGGHISSNPEDHHSRTPQNLGSLDDGGSS